MDVPSQQMSIMEINTPFFFKEKIWVATRILASDNYKNCLTKIWNVFILNSTFLFDEPKNIKLMQ